MNDDKKLRSSLVTQLYFSGAMSVNDLRRDLERTHFLAVTPMAVRGALLWLEQTGLVTTRDDRAQLTEMGHEVGALRVPMPD